MPFPLAADETERLRTLSDLGIIGSARDTALGQSVRGQRLPSTSMSLSLETASVSEGRAAAAKTVVQGACRLARDRLDECRRDRRITAAIAAVIGLAGLAGWAALQILDTDVHARIIFGILTAIAQCAPLVICTMRALGTNEAEEAIASTVESTRMIALQAERLSKIITLASDDAGLSPTARLLVNTLLDDVEQAAAAASNHERRMRGATFKRIRRHARIKPRHDRVIVTTHDNR